MSSNYRFLPANKNVAAGRAVTSTAGTPDSDNSLSWLTDENPATPIQYSAGAWGVSVSIASEDVQLVALVNSSIDANVTVGGSVSGTIVPGTLQSNNIRLNPYLLLNAPVTGATSITLSGTNSGRMLLGELFAGVPIDLKPLRMSDARGSFDDGGQDVAGEFMNVPLHTRGLQWRVWEGSQLYTQSEVDDIVDAWQAQKGNRRPSLLILDDTVNDARAVLLSKPQPKHNDRSDLFEVTLRFIEFPSYEWF